MGIRRVILDGIGNDTDGTVASYLWEQSLGTSVTLVNATTNQAHFDIPNITGTLSFTLTVTDNMGASASDEIIIILE
jgi:chitinase